MYNLTATAYEFHSIDKKECCQCGSWSPKGKQIVFGFPNGKICQYKPDLTLARKIDCPTGTHPGPFKIIAIQWLSTYQFAANFLQTDAEDLSPNLHIINAPKAGPPTYVNYYDICYGKGSRENQVYLTYIQPWNLLLVTSANGMETGIIGTAETGEAPTWVQYTMIDIGRIELPLTDSKQDTFPIGVAYDTASNHKVVLGENELPVMSMVHILSTHGLLISYNFLNLKPNAPGLCSPPGPINDQSGQFKPIEEFLEKTKPTVLQPTTVASVTAADLTFAIYI